VWGVFYKNNELIAFASLLSDFFGSENQYLQLIQVHTSYEHRHKGIGKELFKISAEKAKYMGARKLYISTHSSEESQFFYQSIGCVDTNEIRSWLNMNCMTTKWNLYFRFPQLKSSKHLSKTGWSANR